MNDDQKSPVSAVRAEVWQQLKTLLERARWALCERNWNAADDALAEAEEIVKQQV